MSIPYKHNLYKGLPIASFITEERYRELETLHASREGDVFIVTYQKSGTTWLQHILNLLYDQPQGKGLNVNEAVPWLQESPQDVIDAMSSPRLFKTHDPWDWVLKSDKVKYIYCYRNPKDVCCSYYNHMRSVFTGHYGYTGTLPDFYKDVFVKRGASEQGWYWDHVAGWLAQRGAPNILYLTYEDMVEDLGREVLKIAQFLDIPLSGDMMEGVVRAGMFESMSANPLTNYSWRDGSVKDPNSSFLNKGRVGSWKAKLTEEQSEEMDAITREVLEIPFSIKIRDTL